jgi:PIN domain nuclease of toxin-antitoxin system
VKLLLDTHVALWATMAPKRIPPSIIELISAPSAENLVSVVSIWEIAIKRSAGRRPPAIPASAAEALSLFESAGFSILTMLPEHATAVESLPLLHRDPFDRLLVAQAMIEPARLVTHDAVLASYSDTVIHF